MEQIRTVSVSELFKMGRSGTELSKSMPVKTGFVLTDENLKAAKDVIEAEQYIKDFIKKNGTKAMLSLRIRRGYIGKEIDLPDGTKALQTQRSRPFGVMVALKENGIDKEVSYGISYINPIETHHYPIVGLALALRRAQGLEDPIPVRNVDMDLFNFFTVRARAYFFPERYSRKHGVANPIDYPGYEKIHKNRKLLGYD
jgi:hypothetical protein